MKGDILNGGLTEFKTISAVDVEVVIAGLALAAVGVEDESVRAEFVLRDAVAALVVLVALSDVLERAVAFGAGERLG
jgi:hypothetical protein